MDSFPNRIQDIIHQFEDTFTCKLNEGRMMKTEPVKIELVEGSQNPWKCLKAWPTPDHWRTQANEVLDNLIESGMVRRSKNPTTQYIAPLFNVLNCFNPWSLIWSVITLL